MLNALRPGCARELNDLYRDLDAGGNAGPEGRGGAATRSDGAPEAPLLLLDSDHVALEDIGWIRHMLATARVGEVVLMGSDPSATVVRQLRGVPRARWCPWPPDLDDLRRLLEPAPATAPSGSQVGVPRVSAPRGSEPVGSVTHGPSPVAGEVAGRASSERTPARAEAAHVRPAPTSAADSSSAPPATVFATGSVPPPQAISLTVGRDQVAVLADISQRLELAFLALRESGRVSAPDLEGPQVELRRLLRFTRSLACLAAPPPRGADEFDVAAVIEELLATLTLRGRRGPRFQPGAGSGGKAAVEFVVRADRAALTMAFETVLAVARLCSSSGDTVRVAYTPINGSAVAIQVEFPAGPLIGIDPERLLDVGLLRERLPELGPNELAAAGAIVRSQGGEMDFATPSAGQLAVRMRLPVERRAPAVPDAPRTERTERAGRSSGDDPFA